MKWADTKIDVFTTNGQETVDAKCKGDFAIHGFLSTNERHNGSWKTLTHIPSGMSIISQSTTGTLYRAVKQLEKLDWNNVKHSESPPESFDFESFKRIRREHTRI